MEVVTKQEFDELKKEFDLLKTMMRQVLAAKVTVEWVSVEHAAILLNYSKRTVWRLMKANQLTVLRHGRRVRVGLNSIRTYLLENKYEPAIVEARINSLLAA